MLRMMTWSVAAVIVIGLAINGCSSSTQMALQMQPGQTGSYEATTTMTKDYKFEQPTMKKVDENQTSTTITLMYDQTIADVASDGTAMADIAIRGVRCKTINKNEVRYEFDSADAKYQSDAVNGLMGQSYRIAISPIGRVAVVDANAIRSVAGSGEGLNLVKKALSDENIIARHQLPLPEKAKSLAAKQTWTQVIPSPPGLLAPKTFEKVYTVRNADENQVVVEMVAKESLSKKADGASASGAMGMFAKMFDSQDEFTGKLILNPAGGCVEHFEETLVSTYTASEMPQNAAADALPDTLMMKLTSGLSVKKIK